MIKFIKKLLNQNLENKSLIAENHELRKLIATDELTGLLNLRNKEDIINKELIQAKRRGSNIAVIMLDLDDFKLVNDNFSHLFGNKVLQTVGDLISSNIREGDYGFRFGGDEFMLCLVDYTYNDLSVFLDRFLSKVNSELITDTVSGESINISISVGGVLSSTIDSAESIINKADSALYQVKKTGKNNFLIAC